AAARVAAEFGEDRHDLVGKVDGQVDVAALGLDVDGDLLVAVGRRDLGAAVGQRDDAAGGGYLDDLPIAAFVLHVARQVLLPASRESAADDQLERVVLAFELNPGRKDAKGLNVGRAGQGDPVRLERRFLVKPLSTYMRSGQGESQGGEKKA